MAELPKKDGVDVAWQFLNAITGNTGAILQQRQQELNSYDTELKREQASLNVAQSNIDNAKMSNYITLDIQNNPDKFADMDDSAFSDYIDSVPSLAEVNLEQYSDPLSKITLVSGLKDTQNKLLPDIQLLRTNKATRNLEEDTIQVLQGYSDAPDPVIPGEKLRLSLDDGINALDAIYEKGKLTGANMRTVNDLIIRHAKEEAKIKGENSASVKYVMSKGLGKDSDRNTIQKDITAFNHQGEMPNFIGYLDTDLIGGLSGVKNKDKVKQYAKMYENASDTNKTKMTQTLGDTLITRVDGGETVADVLSTPMGKAWQQQGGRVSDPSTMQYLIKAMQTEQKTIDIGDLYTNAVLNPENGAIRAAIDSLTPTEMAEFDTIAEQTILSKNNGENVGNDYIKHTKQFGTILSADKNFIFNVETALQDINYTPNDEQIQELGVGMERIRDYASQGLLDTVLNEFDKTERDVLNTALNIQDAVGGSDINAIKLAHQVTQGDYDIKNSDVLIKKMKKFYPEIGSNPQLEQYVKTNYSIFRLKTDPETAGKNTFKLLQETVVTQDYQDGKLVDKGGGFIFQGHKDYAVGDGNSRLPLKDTVELIANEYLYIDDFNDFFKEQAKQGITRDDYVVVLQNNPINENQIDVMAFYVGDDTPFGLNVANPELSRTFETRGIMNPLLLQRMQANQTGRSQKAVEQNKQEMEKIQQQGTNVGLSSDNNTFTFGGKTYTR